MKILRLLLILAMPVFVNGQQNSSQKSREPALKNLVKEYLNQKKSEWKLTDADISNWTISSQYTNEKSGTTYLYAQQQVNGISIFNAVSSVSVKDGKINSFAKRFYPDAASKINTTQPANTALAAIRKTADHLGLKILNDPKFVSSKKSLNRSFYSCPDISKDKIRVDLVFQPVDKNLRLAWDVNIHLINGKHWWNVRIDAVTGEVLQKNDWTTHCDFGIPASGESADLSSATSQQPTPQTGNSTSSVPSYRAYPLPLESPNFGPSSLLANPADPNASPYGWHDTNGIAGAEFTITRGNNVFAYDDIANQDMPGTSPDGTASLTFDFPVNFTQQPVNYLNASITNLFYLNNKVHDLLYYYGFDEASGNFQATNYTGNGLGNDYVIAECQDGGGTDNANFSTPDDGSSGWMQMYLWSGAVQSDIVVNSPVAIAGTYPAVPAGFGPSIVAPITGDLVLVDDGNGVTSDACEPIINGPSLSGKIAVIDRGICNFVDKVIAAQNEGAIAVIMINNTAGSSFAMGDNGNGGAVTIPSEMISITDGALFKSTMNNSTVNATLNPPPSTAVDIDGSLDNGVVVHEFGHGVSNRLTGGPLNSNCLFNGEQGGEGWSDYFALVFTMRVGDIGTNARGMATFAVGQPANGYGIRRYPYSTDMTVDPETYGLLTQSAEVHDVGEVWCTVLWEMTWGLVDQFGFDPDWINGTSGNNIALHLVMEGLKLQPCGPGFLDARDAILNADENLYGGIHKCLIWEAFAKRGMGFNANQGSADVAGDETEDFSLPPVCLIPTSAPTADFNSDVTNTCHGSIHFQDLSINTPQAWHWNFGDGDTSNLQNPSHTYTNSGNYDVYLVVTNTLGIDTLLRPAYININYPSQPTLTGDTIICSGNSTTLTAAVGVSDDAVWSNVNDSTLFTGTIFNTPALTTPTTYYVSQFTPTALQHVGPLDATFGTGGYHTSNFEGRLYFTTLAPMRLKSVWVDASGLANRTINVYGPGNTIVQSSTQLIPNGQSRVELNFDLPSPGNYQIGAVSGSGFWRNNGGASYPYTLNGLVNITQSNSTSNPATFYYYFYDWEVQDLPCYSPRLQVNISFDPNGSFTYLANGMTVQFTSTSTGNPATWSWDFGNGNNSTSENPLYNYTSAGTYTVTLTVANSGGCSSTTSQLVTVTTTGINQVTEDPFQVYYSGHDLVVKSTNQTGNSLVQVYDPIGKLLLNKSFRNELVFKTSLPKICPEFIMVKITNEGRLISKKIFLQE